jgi:hypothetical protein
MSRKLSTRDLNPRDSVPNEDEQKTKNWLKVLGWKVTLIRFRPRRITELSFSGTLVTTAALMSY